jgi:hypothetical protein
VDTSEEGYSRARNDSNVRVSGLKTWAWWDIPVISALRKLRQEDQEFQDSLGYVVRAHLQTNQHKNKLGMLAHACHPSFVGD